MNDNQEQAENLAEETTQTSNTDDPKPKKEKLTCGIIMPIASMGSEYPESHWSDVIHILNQAILKAGFEPRIVSSADEATIIHKSIIQNIYNDPIIVCDVSNKNANVMFELGMRLAFNKPVVIVKDNVTGYSFDTSNIEHIPYRKDLRHHTIEKFIDDLSAKVRNTYQASTKNNYQPFLSHFGKFEIAKIENKSIEESEALQKILDKMANLESQVKKQNDNGTYDESNQFSRFIGQFNFEIFNEETIEKMLYEIKLAVEPLGHVIRSIDSTKFDIIYTKGLGDSQIQIFQKKIWKIVKKYELDDDLPF